MTINLKTIAAALFILAAATLMFEIPLGARAVTVTAVQNGGTGTSTPPVNGKVLIGGPNGEYEFSSAGSGSVTNITTTYPVTGGPITTTGAIGLAFGTTTANTWSLYNKFVYGLFATLASSTNATTTGSFYLTGVTASKILQVDATGKVTPLTVGSGLTFDGTTLTASGGSGITSLGPAGQTQTGPAVAIATSTLVLNGQTYGVTVVGAGNTLTLTPTLSGTLGVAGGGTGQSTFTSSQLLYGNGANALSGVATTSATCAGTVSCTAFTVIGSSPITITGSGGGGTGLSTTSPLSGGNLLEYSAAGAGSAFGIATSTLTLGAEFSNTGTIGVEVGGTSGTLSLATNGVGLTKIAQIGANTILGNQTGATGNVTALATSSISQGTGITIAGSGSLIAGSGITITNAGVTSLAGTANQITSSGSTGALTLSIPSQFNIQNASTTNLSSNTLATGGTATTTLGVDGKITGNDVANGFLGRISPTRSFALQTGTTTAMTGTTSAPYIPYVIAPFAGTLRAVRCKTDAGTMGVETQINGVDAAPGYINASTTVGKTTFTSANTFSAGDKLSMINGTPASTPTTISCTFDTTETP